MNNLSTMLNTLSGDNVIELATEKAVDTLGLTVGIVVLMADNGTRRGYLGINCKTKVLEELYESCETHFHGGVTYEATVLETHIFGFDADHDGDAADTEMLNKYVALGFIKASERLSVFGDIRTAEYMRDCIVKAVKAVK